MSNEETCDWIVELDARPDKMKIKNPSEKMPLEESSRLFKSLFSLSIGDQLIERTINERTREEILFEQACCDQDDLKLVWSDDVSLTLVFVASLIHHGSYCRENLLQRYFQWWMNGYLCPAGLCFTPRIDIKKSIDLFGESQLAQSLGLDIDFSNCSPSLLVRSTCLIRLSPIGYFYRNHRSDTRTEIVKDFSRRIFGYRLSVELCLIYVECLVLALAETPSKQSIIELLESAEKVECEHNEPIKDCLAEVSKILSKDENRIDFGIELALKRVQLDGQTRPFFNPLDANSIIVLLVYLQLAAGIYDCLPSICSGKKFYGEDLIESMVEWMIYRSKINLRSV